MKKDRIQKLVLEQLRKMPIIQVVAEKVGVSRSTIYRWKDESKQFHKDFDEAFAEGEDLINDMGESQLLLLMKDKHWPSIAFWLRHRNPKFRNRVEITANLQTPQEELSPEQQNVVREALRLAQLTTNEISNDSNKSSNNKKRSD